eukprot:UN06795
MWCNQEKNPDYKLVQIHGANVDFQSKLDSRLGGYLSSGFYEQMMKNIKRTENKNLQSMLEKIQSNLHDKGKQLIVNVFNNGTSNLTFRKNKKVWMMILNLEKRERKRLVLEK